MLYALIAFHIITLISFLAYVMVSRRDVARERDFWAERIDSIQESRRLREDQLIQRIQAPSAAIAQTTAEHAAQYSKDYPQPSISAFDDEALAEYEQERGRLERETRELVESVDLGAEPVAA